MANCRAIISVAGLLKVLQVVLSVGCIALLRVYSLGFDQTGYFSGGNLDRHLVGHATLGSSVIISFTLWLGYILEHASSGLETMHLIIMGCMKLIAGSLAIETYHDQDIDDEQVQAGLGMGALMILNGLVYFIDVSCRCCRRKTYDPVSSR